MKTYTVTSQDNDLAELVVKIDEGRFGTTEMLHEINNFFCGNEFRLAEADGDIAKAVVTMLANRVWHLDFDVSDVLGHFRTGEEEGWPPLDGSHGIELVDYQPYEISDEVWIEVREA